uniref:Dual specificity phosphatase 22a n=1 Tax=Oryzias sinensis TaxID=183150 RepID=A0A8C7YS45_9TELE
AGSSASQVVDGLYLGNIKDAETRESLSENSITHILSVYNNPKPVFEDSTIVKGYNFIIEYTEIFVLVV